MDAFNDELNSFKERIRGRAKARIDAYMEEVEEVMSTLSWSQICLINQCS